jgi:hypothetical protein
MPSTRGNRNNDEFHGGARVLALDLKNNVEGGEYEVIKSPLLKGLSLLVEWHRGVPKELEHWHIKTLDAVHTLLTPK